MSKKVCPSCHTEVPEDSSFCANCGRSIPDTTFKSSTGNPTGTITGTGNSDLAETLIKTGDYLWPKIVLILFSLVPIIGIFGIMIVASSGLSNITPYAGGSAFDYAGVVVVTLILGVIVVITSIIAYKTYRTLLQE